MPSYLHRARHAQRVDFWGNPRGLSVRTIQLRQPCPDGCECVDCILAEVDLASAALVECYGYSQSDTYRLADPREELAFLDSLFCREA